MSYLFMDEAIKIERLITKFHEEVQDCSDFDDNRSLLRSLTHAMDRWENVVVALEGGCAAPKKEEFLEYENENYNQFVRDLKGKTDDDGEPLKVEHYNGRNYYEGPAVRCESIQDVVRHTSVRCTWDSMGLGYIVYPNG